MDRPEKWNRIQQRSSTKQRETW